MLPANAAMPLLELKKKIISLDFWEKSLFGLQILDTNFYISKTVYLDLLMMQIQMFPAFLLIAEIDHILSLLKKFSTI